MLELYDIRTDLRRAVTQADVDELQRCRAAFGLVVRYLHKTDRVRPAEIAIELVQGRLAFADAEASFDVLIEMKINAADDLELISHARGQRIVEQQAEIRGLYARLGMEVQ